MVGRTISHYKVLEKIGEGGMGVVYKAEDTRLDRAVAVKVLPPDRIGDPQARERFEREAQAISSLNHPHICTLHDMVRDSVTDYLVMEYVEGKLLKGPLPVEEALRLGVQIADALDHAHRNGVVHRDLKPANILVTKSGVKLLDFGLAKLLPQCDPEGQVTRTAGLTKEGTILGTYHYMAPEQWEGKEADPRSDIFAFGAVFYEMVTGRKAFEGRTAASVIAAIMERDPPTLSRVEPMSPPALDHVVGLCLEKDPDKRWQSAADLKNELEWITKGGVASAGQPARQWRWPTVALSAALIVAIGIIVTVLLSRPEEVTQVPLRKFTIAPPGGVEWAAVSPDGKHIAYTSGSGVPALWIHDLGEGQQRQCAGTDGATFPFWSPDSQSIGFAVGDELKKVPVAGGTPVTLCQAGGLVYLGTWSPDGSMIVFPVLTGWVRLYQISARGGTPKLAIEPRESERKMHFGFPGFLPSRNTDPWLLFTMGSLSDPDMMLENLSSGERKTLGQGFAPIYSPSSYLLFNNSNSMFEPGDLWATPFSIEARELTGEPFPVAQDAAWASIAADGTLVYLERVSSGREQLIWRDRSGAKRGAIGQPQARISEPVLSPDGLHVAAMGTEGGNTDIWIHHIQHGSKTRLTAHPSFEERPAWTPDGNSVTFTSHREKITSIYVKPADGSREEKRLLVTPSPEYGIDWSRDGRYLACVAFGQRGGSDIWYLQRRAGGAELEAVNFVATEFNELEPVISPDSRFLAYTSDETGKPEVYVRRFPEGDAKWQVSVNGGRQPRWRRDGKELYYVEGDTLVALAVATEPTFSMGAAKPLFEHRWLGRRRGLQYDVSADGQRFVLAEVPEAPAIAIRVVQNWIAEFRERQQGTER